MPNHPGYSGSLFKPGINRRKLLKYSALGSLVQGLSFPALSQQQAQQQALVQSDLPGGLVLISGAGCNVVALDSDDGLLMVDGGLPAYAEQLLDAALSLSSTGNLRTLINTNWRHEHTGINELLSPALTDIIAHENTRLWMSNDFTVDWEDQRYTPRPMHALPTRTFYETEVLEFANETIELGVLPRAHTDGDIFVNFRDANVLVVSDVLAVNAWLVIDYNTGGWIGGMLDASEAILALADDDTLIIPAIGAPVKKAAVTAQRDMCADIMGRVEAAYSEAQSFEEFLASNPAASYEASRGNAELFLLQAWKGLFGHIRYTRDVYFV